MLQVDNMYPLSAMVELYAAAVTAVLLLGSLIEHRRTGTGEKVFIALLLTNIAMLLCDAAVWLLLDDPSAEKIPATKILTFFSHSLSYTMTALYAYFLVIYISRRRPVSPWYARTFAIICLLAVAVCYGGMFSDRYVQYDASGSETEGPLYWMFQFFNMCLLLCSILLVLRFSKALGRDEMLILVSFGALPLCAFPLEYFWPVTPSLLAATLSLVLVYVVIHFRQTQEAVRRELQLAEQELELTDSRTKIMLSQIQPHFLYNALNSISYLCEKDPLAAQAAVNDFSAYLRGNLDSLKRAAPVPFDAELEHIKTYLLLEKMRFEDELNIVYDIQASGFSLPTLTVQPLVENAVKYGVGKKPAGGTVTLSTREYADRYEIIVADDGVGHDINAVHADGRTHIGIENVRTRLAAMMGGELIIESKPGFGTTATIKLPKEEAK